MGSPAAVENSFVRAQALERGREAVRKHAWSLAFAQLREADQHAPLDPEDLELLSTAGHLIGKEAESGEALARAHQGYLSRGATQKASRCACWLSFVSLLRGDHAQASGWLSRARRLLEQEADCVEHGYLQLPIGMSCVQEGDFGGAHAAFVAAASAGQRFGDRDLTSLGLQGQGRVLVRRGEVARGLGLLDEAMVAVMAGEVSAWVAGGIYCSVIDACGEIFDLRRAQEWTAALERWCTSQAELVPYRAQCLIRRAEILQMQGAWADALLEAQCACERLSQPVPKPAVGPAFYRKAEMHRLRGEFDEAEIAYRHAAQWERMLRPGLALLRLAQGQSQAAYASIRQVTDEVMQPARRAEALSGYVEIALAAEDAKAARAGANELLDIAKRIDAEYVHAMSACADGAVAIADGELPRACGALRKAFTSFRKLEAPYEAARAQVWLAVAYKKQGNKESAALEFEAARATFEKLGAVPDLARLNSLTSYEKQPTQGLLTAREVEVLRLVASGVTNRKIATQLKISEKTVARHVSNIFNKLDLSSRAAATAYAYQQGLLSQRT